MTVAVVRSAGHVSSMLDDAMETELEYSRQVPAVERALNLIEVLAGAEDGLTGGELAERLAIPRSAIYALLNTLRARGYVHQDGLRGRYRLGTAVWSLLPDRSGTLRVLVDAFHLETGNDPGEESIALSWPEPGGAVLAAHVPGTRPVRVAYQTAERRSQDAADGIVLAAGLPADGPGDDLFHRVRRDGAAVTRVDDVVEIACPVCADGVRPVAALVVGVPAYRAGEDEVTAITGSLREMAARMSYRMGAAVYQPYGWAVGDSVGPSRDLTDAELKEFLVGAVGRSTRLRPPGRHAARRAAVVRMGRRRLLAGRLAGRLVAGVRRRTAARSRSPWTSPGRPCAACSSTVSPSRSAPARSRAGWPVSAAASPSATWARAPIASPS